MYTADVIVQKVKERGYPEFNKRIFYYYLYDKKMYGDISKKNKTYSLDLVDKTLNILYLKNNTRLTLDEIKECIKNKELVSMITSSFSNSYVNFDTLNTSEINSVFCSALATTLPEKNEAQDLSKNRTIASDLETYTIANASASTGANTISCTSNNKTEAVSDITICSSSLPNNLDKFNSNICVPNGISSTIPMYSPHTYPYIDPILYAKNTMKINEDIYIVYNEKKTKEVIKIADLFLKELEQENKIEQFEIYISSYEEVLQIIKTIRIHQDLTDKNKIKYFKNERELNDIFDEICYLQPKDVLRVSGNKKTIDILRKEFVGYDKI